LLQLLPGDDQSLEAPCATRLLLILSELFEDPLVAQDKVWLPALPALEAMASQETQSCRPGQAVARVQQMISSLERAQHASTTARDPGS
ncbi:unnamed protein product, partial [Polarella glacialis]